jgi:4-aminobutyrate aminotransferase-like enzyme
VDAFSARERESFLQRNPKSVALAERARHSLYAGVPMHWMADWSTPCPLFVERAKGARFHDVDGHAYIDFCLGDTGSMFGHSPEPIAKAIAEQASNGLTTMLPGEDAVVCGELLAARFGLPFWQVTATATDSNRYVLRWARAITQRKTLLVFDGCYHGSVDDVMVRCRDGATQPRAGLIGQAYDLTQYSRSIPFNDVAALEAALAEALTRFEALGPRERAALGEAGREAVKAQLDPARVAARRLEALRAVASRTAPPAAADELLEVLRPRAGQAAAWDFLAQFPARALGRELLRRGRVRVLGK